MVRVAGYERRIFWLCGLAALAMAAGCGDNPPTRKGPSVELINKDYNRLTSIVLIRRVHRLTLADLEFAVYDSNVMREAPGTYTPTPPKNKPKLADLHFGETLVADTLVDRVEKTPLTEAERNAPMAWDPMGEYLLTWDFDLGLTLMKAVPAVTDEAWGDQGDRRVPFQEITRLYLHREDDGQDTFWVRIEFRPWVTFLDGIDDEDGDGFPEIYGQINPNLTDPKIAARLRDDYTKRVFSAEEIRTWSYELGSFWYPTYNTVAAKWDEKRSVFQFEDDQADEDNKEQITEFPSQRTEAEVMNALKGVDLKPTDVIVRGRPHGKNIYNLLLIGSP